MTTPAETPRRPLEVERYLLLGMLLLLLLGCYLVVRPFLTAFLWGGIISLSTRGLYHRCLRLVGGRAKIAATLTALGLVAILLVPVIALAANVTDAVPLVKEKIDAVLAGGLQEPPAWISGIPLIGGRAADSWRAAAANPERLREQLRPYLGPLKDFAVAAAGGIGIGVVEFALSLFVAALLYVSGDQFSQVMDRVAERLGGAFARRQLAVVRGTVRSVFRGLIGTAAVQAILAIIGFWIAGVPHVFLFGMGTFFLSVVPGGPTVLWLPAALWLNANGSSGHAIFLAIWGLVVIGGSDNIVRPLLIGKGTEAPMAIIFLGVIGGILAFGFLGLFIGPVLLTVAYNLVREWMDSFAPRPAPAASASP
jgi:predicted PurR-regulated permease PerM